MDRYYINLTNKCNTECEFCCMYSSPKNKTFISDKKFEEIIDSTSNQFELQLEGGEPLLHDHFFEFMKYAVKSKRCTQINILTNGILLNKFIDSIIEFHKENNIPIMIKVSINYWLYNKDKECINKVKTYIEKIKDLKDFTIKLNVRMRIGDGWIKEKIYENKLEDYSNIFYLQRYGRYKNKKEYEEPFTVPIKINWSLYASDGTCFYRDLIARSEYEHKLSIIDMENEE